MEIFLNNEPVQFELNGSESVKDVTAALFQWLEQGSGRIDSFLIDGEPLDGIFDQIKDEPHSKIEKIEITFTPAEWIRTVWAHENPKALLKETLASLREKEKKIKMFSVDIQMNKPDEAYQNAAELIREIRTALMILRRLQEEKQIASDEEIGENLTVADYPAAVNGQLKKINRALAENDFIEAGDLFEYEILPLIDALRNSSAGENP